MPSPDRPNSGRADSKYFIGPLKAKKKFIILNHFNVKFYFSNACLNSVEHILFPSKQKFKRTGAWFQVSKRFVFSLSPLNIEHLLLTMLKTAFLRYSHVKLIWRIARKSIKIKIYLKCYQVNSLFHVNKMYTSYGQISQR